ncbi:MAG TPA: 30S ribosomal protein S16 [bacterium]|nr:30S ribosomal protein S16 [bacterium]
MIESITMVKIRLQKRGKKGHAQYRVVVAESTRSRDSKYIDDLGYYDPHLEKKFNVDIEKVKDWLAKGAQPTDTVAQYLVKEGVLKDWRKTKRSKLAEPKKKKKSPAEDQKVESEVKEEEKKEESPSEESKDDVQKPEGKPETEQKSEAEKEQSETEKEKKNTEAKSEKTEEKSSEPEKKEAQK